MPRSIIATAALATLLGLLAPSAMAGTVTASNGKLHFTAAPGEVNDVAIGDTVGPDDRDWVSVSDTGAAVTASAPCIQDGDHAARCPYFQYDDPVTPEPLTLEANLGDESDTVTASGYGVHSIIDGGEGDDAISLNQASTPGGFPRSGSPGTASGGPGDDSLSSHSVSPSTFRTVGVGLDGGEGNDALTPDCSMGGSTYAGGGGHDSISFANCALTNLRVILDDTANDGVGGHDWVQSDIEDVIGTPRFDILTGSPGDNMLDGGGGADTLDGGFGADDLIGGSGDDLVTYARRTAGVSISRDGNANDGNADDVGAGGRRDNISSDVEKVTGTQYGDTLIGGPAADVLTGGDGPDTIYGGAGNDAINGGPGNDILHGETDNDTVTGGDGDDQIDGEDGSDTLHGDNGADVLRGSTGGDTLDGGNGPDDLFGGTGVDTVTYATRADAVSVDIDGNSDDGSSIDQDATGRRDNVGTSVENVIGGAGPDVLTGAAGANSLVGLGGNDQLYGGPGDDNLQGEAGDDQLSGGTGGDDFSGGTGSDTASYAERSNGVRVQINNTQSGNSNDATSDGTRRDYIARDIENLVGGAGPDTLIGSSSKNRLDGGGSNDVLYGYAAADSLHGSTGDDSLDGGPGPDDLFGGSGIDTASYMSSQTGVVADLDGAADDGSYLDQDSSGRRDLIGTSVENVTGSAYDDDLTGNSGDNTLMGRAGEDSLDGKSGVDRLYGEAGNDTLTTLDGVRDARISCGEDGPGITDSDVATADSFDPVGSDCEARYP